MRSIVTLAIGGLLLCSEPLLAQNNQTPGLQNPALRDARRTTALMADEVRHQLVTLPYYDVFDWLEAEVLPNGTVILRGEVTRPTTKSGAEKRVKSLESVAAVQNEIEVLPVSQMDEQLRRQIYRRIFNFDSSLSMYALRAVPPIHIIVKGGRATLKGIVLNDMDRQLAETAARGVPGLFEVKNELKVENPKTSRN